MTTERTCASCAAFFDYADASNRGECRRRSPCMIGDNLWPVLARFDWCAEHLEHAPETEVR